MRPYRFSRPRNPTLQVAVFDPPGTPRAAVFVTPGFSEHIGRYVHVAESWARAGFLVAVHDARGHGDSEGRRAHVDRFTDYTGDVLALLDDLGKRPEFAALGKPILFGHSMGGLITTLVAVEEQSRFRAIALSSPFYARALETPAWKTAIGRFVSGFWPTYSDTTGVAGSMVTHDPERARVMDEDPKRLKRVTARWFTEMEWAHKQVFEHAPRLGLPVFCMAAGEDVIADVTATERVFARFASSQKELRILPGERHELHQEVKRDTHIAAFAERFASWV